MNARGRGALEEGGCVGERVPTGVGRRDDPEGDPVEATRRNW